VWDGETCLKIKIECRSCLLQTKEIGVLKTQIVINWGIRQYVAVVLICHQDFDSLVRRRAKMSTAE